MKQQITTAPNREVRQTKAAKSLGKGISWTAARRILCIRLDSMGDVLMTTPAMRALKAGSSRRKITLLTSPVGAEVAELIPDVDDTWVYDAPWMKATSPRSGPSPDLEMVERLRRAAFDAAVIFTVFSQNPLPAAFMTYLAEIPLRLAYSRENPYQMLTHYLPDPWPQDEGRIPHEVRRHLDLAAAVGCTTTDERLSIRAPQASGKQIEQRLERIGLETQRPWLVIHPGASAPSRRYPPQSFAAVAATLVRQFGFQIVFTGTQSEVELVESICSMAAEPVYSLAGQLSLAEFTALLERTPLLISNNTGPVHIAAGLGTPVVDLYALTNPQHTPWQVPNRVLYYDVPCKFCYKSICPEGHHNCLRKVTPGEVVQAALDLFEEVHSQAKIQRLAA